MSKELATKDAIFKDGVQIPTIGRIVHVRVDTPNSPSILAGIVTKLNEDPMRPTLSVFTNNGHIPVRIFQNVMHEQSVEKEWPCWFWPDRNS